MFPTSKQRERAGSTEEELTPSDLCSSAEQTKKWRRR